MELREAVGLARRCVASHRPIGWEATQALLHALEQAAAELRERRAAEVVERKAGQPRKRDAG